MKIALLAEHVEAIPALAEWYRQEWEPYYGPDGPGDARADLASRCNATHLPVGLVAVDGNRVCGTVALDTDIATKLSPSIVGLLVVPGYRRLGIATRLIGAATDLARNLGFSSVYLSTTVLGDYLRRKGWQMIGEKKFLDDETGAIYRCELRGPA